VALSDNRVLIIVPIFVKPEDDTAPLIRAIEELTADGVVYVSNQKERVEFPSERDGKIIVVHTEQALGIWGALHVAWRNLAGIHMLGDLPEMVVLNLAPLAFTTGHIRAVMAPVQTGRTTHAIGERFDIAESLDKDPVVGRSRALLECFFTALASVRLKVPMTAPGGILSPDGFTGLHAFTRARYEASTWEWIVRQAGKQPWGGALVSQVQSYARGTLPHPVRVLTGQRTWASSLGADMKAVTAMLDKVRLLPFFDGVTKEEMEEAYKRLHAFGEQPWFEKATAVYEVRKLLQECNRGPTPILDFAA